MQFPQLSLLVKSASSVCSRCISFRSLHMRTLSLPVIPERRFPYNNYNAFLSLHLHKNRFGLIEQKIHCNYYSSESDSKNSTRTSPIPKLSGDEEHIVFKNKHKVIQDVIDEEWNPLPETEQEYAYDPYANVNRTRGKTGVFDIDELVDLLYEERSYDICVIQIPQETKYADYMVIATARNAKQMVALGTFIRKRFKLKEKKSTDVLPKLEGTKYNKDWISLDLGNIILHLFTEEKRDEMDLETLWAVGPTFDDLTNAKDPEIVQLLNSYNGEERRHKW